MLTSLATSSASGAGSAPRSRWPRALLSLVVAGATLLGGATVAMPSARADSLEDIVTGLLNDERTGRGLPALATRDDLVAVARSWASTMASEARLYHNPDLTTLVADWNAVGENVGFGPDALTVHLAFMGSPGHQENVLDTDYTEVGVGAVLVDGRVWVVEVFRQPVPSPSSATAATIAVDPLASPDGTVALEPAAGPAPLPSQGTTTNRRDGTAAFPGVLRHGSRGTGVRTLQSRLDIPRTGYYGNRTERSVTRFQRAQGLRASGVVGWRTWRRLF